MPSVVSLNTPLRVANSVVNSFFLRLQLRHDRPICIRARDLSLIHFFAENNEMFFFTFVYPHGNMNL